MSSTQTAISHKLINTEFTVLLTKLITTMHQRKRLETKIKVKQQIRFICQRMWITQLQIQYNTIQWVNVNFRLIL